MENSSLEFIVVAEARADKEIACELADRVFVEEGPGWLRDFAPQEPDQSEENPLNYLRQWTGFEEGTPFTKWAGELKEFVRNFRPGARPLGHSKHGQSNKYDYTLARKAIIVAALLMKDRPIRALLLIRDMDKEWRQRKDSLERARSEERPETLKVVIGIENPVREAWVLNGFEPETLDETKALKKLAQEFGFNPCEHADQVKSHEIKDVLKELIPNPSERERQCWRETSLDLLKKRGEKTGLRDYLEDVKVRLLPLLNQP